MKKIIVGMGTCGLSAGAQAVYDRLEELVAENPDNCELHITGCIGMCFREPLVEINDGNSRVIYGGVNAKTAEQIMTSHVLNGQRVEDDNLVYFQESDGATGGQEAPYLDLQERIVLRNCGNIDPESIEEYIAVGGYDGARKALLDMSPEEIIDEVKESGLRGRGGAGFPTGLKWGFCAGYDADQKYVVCNADEGDPGAFMDRSVLEGDPTPCWRAWPSSAPTPSAPPSAYIYCRAEYPLAIKRLEHRHRCRPRARASWARTSWAPDSISTSRSRKGAGAFVCGEETALFASIEGQRGMPRIRPPFPAEAGLWQKPTNNNNVETYANVPWIVQQRRRRLQGPTAPRRARAPRSSPWPARSSAAAWWRCPWASPSRAPLRHRRRHPGRRRVQGRADGRPLGRLHPRDQARHPGGLREHAQDRRHHGLRRHGGHGRDHLHGGRGPLLPRLHPEGELRQVHLLPYRHPAHARDPGAHHRAAKGKDEDIDKLKSWRCKIKEASLCGLGRPRPTRC
jgi:(2Fe-2S) ferredoxin